MKTKIFLSLIAAAAALGMSACGGAQKESNGSDDTMPMEVQSEAEQHMSQAGLSLSEGDNEGALAHYLAAADIFDKSGKVTVERAEAHFLAADLAYRLSEREMAIEEYEKAVDIYLRFKGNSRIKAANALNNMGTIYKELQNKSRAMNCWNRALEIYREAPPEFKNEANTQKIEQNIRDLEAGF